MHFEVEQYVTNPPFAENSYFIFDNENKIFMVVDPGDGAAKNAEKLVNSGFSLERILITHVHIDHTWDLLKLTKIAPDAKICLHPNESEMIASYAAFAQMIGIYDADPLPDLADADFVKEGDVFMFGDDKFQVIHVPGHTKGHVAYYCGDAELKFAENALTAEPSNATSVCFVGDLIFEGGVGRTDFPGGSWEELTNSIKNKIYKLPDQTILYNGHGRKTTVKNEKSHNSFVRE